MEHEFTPPPRIKALTPSTLAGIHEDVLESVLINYVVDSALADPNDPADVAQLPQGLRIWYLAFVVDAEVLNGGFNQLFFNPTGALVPQAPLALTEIGLPEAADLVNRALALVGSHAPALEAAIEKGTVEAFMESYIDQPFSELDAEYAAGEAEFRQARLRFIRDNPGAFTHP